METYKVVNHLPGSKGDKVRFLLKGVDLDLGHPVLIDDGDDHHVAYVVEEHFGGVVVESDTHRYE